nr:hypothetical protein [Tanacetum cinerariifolium]
PTAPLSPTLPPATTETIPNVIPTNISLLRQYTRRARIAQSSALPTASPIFTTASVVTPYSRRKGKENMVESDTPKKKKLQDQIDVHIAREMEEQMVREDQRRNEQIARDA